ncbi:unknown [Bacteroides sp. CAG:927]|nr:unknown [Bacteroides sp. CAG:927]
MGYLINAQSAAKKAANYNLDELVDVFICNKEPQQLRRELQSLYFRLVNAYGDGNECLGGVCSDELYTLQTIIEAVDSMTNNAADSRVVVVAKQ